jgi:ADP-heptose:LPS heptosyltransferase
LNAHGGTTRRPVASTDAAGRRSVLVLRSGALGDFVLTVPVLRHLGRAFGGATVTYGGRPEFGALARASGLADRIFGQDDPAFVALFQTGPDGPQLARRIGTPQLVVSYLGSREVTDNVLRAGAYEVVSAPARPREGAGVHAADHLLAGLRHLVEVDLPAVPALQLGEDARRHAREVLGERGITPGRFVICHLGSGAARKNWPAPRFARVAQIVAGRARLGVVATFGPAEEDQADELRAAFARTDAVWLERPRLALLAAVLAECAAYVGNDSGVTHLAAACGAPTVAVFGPSDPSTWSPRGPTVRVLRDASADLLRVSPEAVAAAVQDLLEA